MRAQLVVAPHGCVKSCNVERYGSVDPRYRLPTVRPEAGAQNGVPIKKAGECPLQSRLVQVWADPHSPRQYVGSAVWCEPVQEPQRLLAARQSALREVFAFFEWR